MIPLPLRELRPFILIPPTRFGVIDLAEHICLSPPDLGTWFIVHGSSSQILVWLPYRCEKLREDVVARLRKKKTHD
jgi:hypothetical protein